MGDAPTLQGHLLCALPFAEPPELVDRLRSKFPNLTITYKHSTRDDPLDKDQGIPDELWKDVTVLATLSALPTLELGKNLELVQLISAGSNTVQLHDLYTKTQIPIATASGIHGPAISEWVVMTALASAHYLPLMLSWQQGGTWGSPDSSHAAGPRSPLRDVRDMVGQRVGVLGYGSIGRQVGRVVRAMGMEVYAFTASPKDTADSRRDDGYIPDGIGDREGEFPARWFSGLDKPSLHHFLGQDLDYLIVCVPLTDQTMGMLSGEEFRILSKKNAFVANISRGQIIDQDALIAALEAFDRDSDENKGKMKVVGVGRAGLRGAALDVAYPEPLPKGHPLFSTPNCIVTPHISGLSTVYVQRALEVLELNLERLQDGGKLVNIVDRKKGY